MATTANLTRSILLNCSCFALASFNFRLASLGAVPARSPAGREHHRHVRPKAALSGPAPRGGEGGSHGRGEEILAAPRDGPEQGERAKRASLDEEENTSHY